MDKSEIRFCVVAIGLMLLILGTKAYLTITSLDVQKSQNYLYPDGNSIVVITVVPLNRFGNRIPFRKPDVAFILQEGAEKVKVINRDSDMLGLKARFEIGNIIVIIKNKYTIMPIRIEIPIIKPTA
jgi:hypothetical protein